VAEPRTCTGLVNALANWGVEARVLYQPALHRTPAFAQHADRALPTTDDLSGRILCLPVQSAPSAQEAALLEEALDYVFPAAADVTAMTA
jgi:dTDP-4-amino-4,6-dideoxygalactose transaminase